MTVKEIKELVYNSDKYDFLKTNNHIKDNIVLLTLGGSYAYGTNVETSDIDIRGIAKNSATEILLGKDFEQVESKQTDTAIYSINKIFKLLTSCNPNCIEIVGCKPEHYIYLSDIGRFIIEHRHIFLSKECVRTFGGYAYAQLRRLENKCSRDLDFEQKESYILNTINNCKESLCNKFFTESDNDIELFIGKSDRDDVENEILMNIRLNNYPLRDYVGMISEMQNIVRDYEKIGKRNKNAIERGKLGKHMMHLIRLYAMCIDILENQEIITYREQEHDLLMQIRNNQFLDCENNPTKDFYDLVSEYQHKMGIAEKKTTLPDKPDIDKINHIHAQINNEIVSTYPF
jgi:predicted nucleotidyltransferase